MTRRFQALALMARRFGWRNAFGVGVDWLLRQTFNYRSAILFRLDTETIKELAGCERFQWGYEDPLEIEMHGLQAAGLSREELKNLVAAGEQCFTGRTREGDLCYLSLVSRNGFHIPGRISVHFSGNQYGYVGNCITLHAYRGMGIYPCALIQLAACLRAEGRRWLCLYVERENLPSIHGVEKVGFQRIGAASVLRIGRRAVRRWRPYDPAAFTD